MGVDFDVQSRGDKLEEQLGDDVRFEWKRAAGDYWIAFTLMVAALVSSVAAGLGGIAFGWTARHTGMVAFIPGIMAIAASTMKFEGKSNWHYRKQYALMGLKSRLLFELPPVPSVDNIAAISKARRDSIDEMQKAWEAELSLDFSQFKPHTKSKPDRS